ncbi:MAG: hypothetical protein RL308_474 [Bacteroidota bacterium]|jgi:hypothetical protein
MLVTIIQGSKVNNQVFEAIRKFLNNTIETKGKRIKPVLTFKFIQNQEQEQEFEIENIEGEIRKIRLEEKVDPSNTGKEFEYYFKEGEEIRKSHTIPNDELLILLSGEKNNRNFLGYVDDSLLNAFIYTNGWNRIYSNEIDSIYPIIYEIYCWIIRANMFDNSDELYQSTHKNNEGCAMDFCEDLKDHKHKSRCCDICETCNGLLIKKAFREDVKQHIYNTLDIVRRSILRRDSGRNNITEIEFNYVNGKMVFIVPNYDNLIIEFTPQEKSVYYFFLYHPEGISYKEVFKYRNELYEIYKEFSIRIDEDNEDVVNRMIGYNQDAIYHGKGNLSGVITQLNLKLKAVFNSQIIDHYILKKSKEKYSISLERDFFIDNSGINLR